MLTDLAQSEELQSLVPKKVLLADDNQISCRMFEKQFEFYQKQYTLSMVVNNGLAAVEAVKKDNYDIVLIDHQMPQCGGIEAIRQIRALSETDPQKKNILIILTSVSPVDEKEYAELNVSFIRRQGDMKKFFKALEDVIKQTSATQTVLDITQATEFLPSFSSGTPVVSNVSKKKRRCCCKFLWR